ncbi:hypothetical protein TWF594_004283 [Orbilia oligospora]|nr:hypothetical protein TWF594_004283 [Orbilia oligospora]
MQTSSSFRIENLLRVDLVGEFCTIVRCTPYSGVVSSAGVPGFMYELAPNWCFCNTRGESAVSGIAKRRRSLAVCRDVCGESAGSRLETVIYPSSEVTFYVCKLCLTRVDRDCMKRINRPGRNPNFSSDSFFLIPAIVLLELLSLSWPIV